MKAILQSSLLFLCLSFLAGASSLPAASENKQEHMEKALHLLQDAKQSDKPLPVLKSAKKALEHASHNKWGSRKEAIRIVEKAIEAAEAGDTKTMMGKIDSAIAQVHDAMSKSS